MEDSAASHNHGQEGLVHTFHSQVVPGQRREASAYQTVACNYPEELQHIKEGNYTLFSIWRQIFAEKSFQSEPF